jgi:hypothetical protein
MFLLSSCSAPGRVVDENGTVFSEYFQCMIYVHDGDFSFDAVKTLGNERFPEAYVFSKEDKEFLDSPDTLEEVYEVYLRNHTSLPIEIVLMQTTEGAQVREFNSQSYNLKARKWAITEPIVSVSSIYSPNEVACSVTYSYLGGIETAQGIMRRLTVEDIRR